MNEGRLLICAQTLCALGEARLERAYLDNAIHGHAPGAAACSPFDLSRDEQQQQQ